LGQPFGRLLALDLYDCRPGACDDIALCYNFLEDLVALLGMTKQSPPFLFRSPADAHPDKAGLSGWVPLIESGIQIHTLSPRGFISIDVYSCGEIREEGVLELARAAFGYASADVHWLTRGMRYHAEPERVG